jgi:CRISPR system Cascade subunit CasB
LSKPPQFSPTPLIEHLHNLVRDPQHPDRAALAALRRGLGKQPGTVPEMYHHVEPYLGGASKDKADAAYVVASLFGIHPVPWRQPSNPPKNLSFGWTLRGIRFRENGSEDEGVTRRFVAALNSDREALPTHLRHLFSLLRVRQPSAPVNWERLFTDLVIWDAPGRYAQRRWAEGFWRNQTSRTDQQPDPASRNSGTAGVTMSPPRPLQSGS